MAEETGITWAKSTWNPWIGCTKVGPGCDNCYAERMDARGIFQGTTHWGTGAPRMRTSASNWAQVRRWNAKAPDTEFAGRRGYWPVFTASLADIFDNEVPEAWRADYWAMVRECRNLTFLIVTKRIGNAARMLPPDWGDGYPNVVLLATVVNQAEADRDVPKLLATPARARGLSMEPLLGPVDLTRIVLHSGPITLAETVAPEWQGIKEVNVVTNALRPGKKSGTRLDWIIVGGESGSGARPMHPDWAYSLRDQCEAAGVPFHFKQWGEWATPGMRAFGTVAGEVRHIRSDGSFWDPPPEDEDADCLTVVKVGKDAAGRVMALRTHDDIPELHRG